MASKYSKIDPQKYNGKKPFYLFIVYLILYPIIRILLKMEVHGKENIPKDTSNIIFASNHTSYFDPPVTTIATRKYVAYMAKEELFHVPLLSQAIQGLGAFSVNREKLEVSTIKTAKNIISKTDWFLGIFPEGTRIMNGKVGKINPGFCYLAKATKAQVIPVGIKYKRDICPMFGKLVVKIGKPIDVPENPEDLMELWGQAISDLTGIEFDRDIAIPTKNEESKEEAAV